MSAYVCVPRAALSKYQHAKWSQLVAAAESGADGLRSAVPQLELANWTLEAREQLNKENRAVYDAQVDLAFFREGDRAWPADTATLFQQNWNKS